MTLALASGMWSARAASAGREQPEARVGIREGPQLLPCRGNAQNNVCVDVFGTNVPASGNCLYHAVWSAAEFAGVREPFGMPAAEHVFTLRVRVGEMVVRLLQEKRLHDAFGNDPLHVGDLVARPNQYLEYSGVIPIMAMASMLKRQIVTLCADGVFVVTPEDLSSLVDEPVVDEPVVIYHCAAGRVVEAVRLCDRNHYIAACFSDADARRTFVNFLRRRSAVIIEQNRDVIIVDNPAKRLYETPENLHNVPRKRARSQKTCTKTKHPCNEAVDTNGRLDKEGLDALIAESMSVKHLPERRLNMLRRNFTKHPRLALLYFHCCSTDLETCVFADEQLGCSDSEAGESRLLNVLDAPVDAKVAKSCQDRVSRSSASSGDLWACASCCEFLNTVEDDVEFIAIDKLHRGFELTPSEVEDINQIPSWVVDQHLQVLSAEGKRYHLNPELVHDFAAIPLCKKCAGDPRKSEFSTASGHDYGRVGELPELGDVASKCIAPVRPFKLEIALSGKHSIGHSICFPSDGPVECLKVLPCTSEECIPRVTFVGPRGKWENKKKSIERIFALPADNMYEWMRVLSRTHSYFADNHVWVDKSDGARSALHSLENKIYEEVEISESASARSIDDDVIAERFGEEYADDGSGMPIISKSAVLKDVDGLDLATRNAGDDFDF